MPEIQVNTRHTLGLSLMVHLSEHAPYTSENVGSILVIMLWTRVKIICQCKIYNNDMWKKQAPIPKSRGFSPGAPVSFHRES